MANVFRKYQKRIVSVFLVGLMSILMVAFLLPEGGFMGPMGPRHPAGHAGGQRVFEDEIHLAWQDWNLLRNVLLQAPGLPRPYPALYRLGGDELIEHIDQHQVMFYLLLREAREMGVQVSQDQLEGELQNAVFQGRPPSAEAMRRALHSLFMVEGAFERIAGVVRVSQPQREIEMAIQGQMIQVNLVDFRAADYLDRIEQPTDEQLLAHYERYADQLAGQPDPVENPFGFGYRYPDRVALQYIQVTREQVRQAVLESQSEYDWEVAARRYYRANRSMFETTDPPPLPAAPLALDLLPPLALNPQTGPRVREFWEVEEEIMDRLVEPQVDRRFQSIQQQINTALRDDYATWQRDPDAISSVGAPYDSYEYLQRLANQVQQRHHVRPIIASHPTVKSQQDLLALHEVAYATFRDIPLAAYAVAFARPIAEQRAERRREDDLLEEWQPSPVFRDDGDFVIFRLTDARPSRRPAAIDEVYRQVLRDWQTARSYELAMADAEALAAAAEQRRLAEAAEEHQRSVITTSPFRASPFGFIQEYPLTGLAYARFTEQAFRLINEAGRTGSDHPVRLAPLPEATRVLVLELERAAPVWDEQLHHIIDRQLAMQLQQRLTEPLRQQWFNYEAVAARTEWRELDRPDAPAPADEPAPIARTPVGR